MQITTIGLDLAKQVFQVHGMDARGHTVLVKQVRRDQMHAFFANLAPCRIGMKSCAGAHYWGRELTRLGHDARLMAPQRILLFGIYWYFTRRNGMSRNTSVALGEHFTSFIDTQVQGGRYGSASDVVRAGLRLLEEHETKVRALQEALNAGLESGEPRPFDSAAFLSRMRAKHG